MYGSILVRRLHEVPGHLVFAVGSGRARFAGGAGAENFHLTVIIIRIWLDVQSYGTQMSEPGRDNVSAQPRIVFSPSLRTGSRRLANTFLIGLTVLAWSWVALAGHAVWQFAATVDGLLSLTTRPRALTPPSRPTHSDALEPPIARSTLSAPRSAGELLDRGMRQASGVVPLHETAEEASGTPSTLGLPPALAYRGATCSGVFVYIVTLSERSPRHSAVSFATSDSVRSSFARPGQMVGPWEVLAITDDWTGANPMVWLVQGDEVCRTGLTGNPVRARMAQQQQREKRVRKSRRRRR